MVKAAPERVSEEWLDPDFCSLFPPRPAVDRGAWHSKSSLVEGRDTFPTYPLSAAFILHITRTNDNRGTVALLSFPIVLPFFVLLAVWLQR